MKRIGIIGGGAAGLMAAIGAGDAPVLLFEKMPVPGKKLSITGKGRCNVTNAAALSEYPEKILRGEKFCRSALAAFGPENVRAFFEERGVPLKVERGGRVFPMSDNARDVVSALVREAKKNPNLSLIHEKVLSIEKTPDGFCVRTEKRAENLDAVILATGGATYPGTGSTGDGYAFAASLGHTVTPLSPSLVPLVVKETDRCRAMQGLSLKNAGVRFLDENGKRAAEDFGEMLFTHFGVSGPVILTASGRLDFSGKKTYRLLINTKPALTDEMLDARLLREIEAAKTREMKTVMSSLLPAKMILPVLEVAGIDPKKKACVLSKSERLNLKKALTAFPLTVTGTRPMAEGIVTRGGIATKEVDPRSMQSKLVPGLYLAGELLDIDAVTGGFNLQLAFSTGHLAGKSAAKGG